MTALLKNVSEKINNSLLKKLKKLTNWVTFALIFIYIYLFGNLTGYGAGYELTKNYFYSIADCIPKFSGSGSNTFQEIGAIYLFIVLGLIFFYLINLAQKNGVYLLACLMLLFFAIYQVYNVYRLKLMVGSAFMENDPMFDILNQTFFIDIFCLILLLMLLFLQTIIAFKYVFDKNYRKMIN